MGGRVGASTNYNKINKKILDRSAQSNPRENLVVSSFLFFFTTQEKNLKTLHSTVYALIVKTKTKHVHSSGPGVPTILLSGTQLRKIRAGGRDPTVVVHVA